jgi:cytochrome c-type biogenesis protein CcmF
VTEKRGSFKNWTVLLAILAFSLSLLGTFLVRSGVLTSVHAFATDPKRGVFILIFLAVVIGTSLVLFAWRAPKVGLGGRFDLVSRESMLLGNNVLLVVACASVLLGTLYPLLLDALGMGKVSVGPPYFQSVFVPLMAPALFLMGIGPIARWKSASLPELAVRLRWAFAVSLIAALLLPFTMDHWSVLVSFGLLLAFWILASNAYNLWTRIKPASGAVDWSRARAQSRSYYGMLLAHCGIAVFVIGVTLVKSYEVEKDVRMETGDTVHVGGYEFRFDGVTEVPGPNYKASRGTLQVTRNGQPVTVMTPEKRVYFSQPMPMTEASISPGLTRDLYVSLGEPVGDAWIVRVYYKPFVDWIWGGCLLMALGGFFAVSDRRYRLAQREAAASAAAAAGATA